MMLLRDNNETRALFTVPSFSQIKLKFADERSKKAKKANVKRSKKQKKEKKKKKEKKEKRVGR